MTSSEPAQVIDLTLPVSRPLVKDRLFYQEMPVEQAGRRTSPLPPYMVAISA